MKKRAKIAVIGSYLAGLTMKMQRFPTPGETLIGHSFSQFHGGKGSNQAVACARMGADVAFATCIGRDAMGEAALALYDKERVDARYVRALDDQPTGVGFILVNQGGENQITLDLGACNQVSPEYVDTLRGMIAEADMVLCQLEVPVNAVCRVAELADALGTPMLLNPAPWQPLPEWIYPKLSLITPNQTEARALLGLDAGEDITVDALARRILEKGARRAVITLGADGAYFAEAGGACGHMPAAKANVVDTTGAGDTFSAALAVALCEGRGFERAVEFAQHAAALAVGRYGVIEALPYRADVDAV